MLMDKICSRHHFSASLPKIFLSLMLAVCMLVAFGALGEPKQAYAVTAAEKQAELDEAFVRLDALQTEINQLAADYEVAVVAHADAEARMLDAQDREDEARARLTELQEQLRNRAAKMYRNGNSSYLDVLFGVQTFNEFVTAMDLINRVNEQEVELVRETKTVKAEAEEARIEYTEQERVAREQQQQIATILSDKEATELAMQDEIAALEKEVEELEIAEELAREAALAAAEAANANTGIGSYGSVSDDQTSRVTALNLQYPFSSRQTISSGFGWRDFDSSFHLGTDFAAPGGTPILAIAPGTVAAAGWGGMMGNYVIISHGNGVRSIYMHASGLNCSAGQAVSAGDVIAYVGTTGNSTGNHLHLQIEVDLVAVNPMLYM